MSFSGQPHILFLPRWYPNRYDSMPGLFIRLQAEALAIRCEVTVLYVHADPDCPNKMETEFGTENRVRVIRVYYQPGSTLIGRWIRFFRAHFSGLAILGSAVPDLVHVHVLTREGFMGYLIARRFRVPFVISEHWSRYFPENDYFRGFWKKQFTRFIVGRAAAVLPVSRKLRESMVAKGLAHRAYHIVPNVIDEERFKLQPAASAGGTKRLVHVSCFDNHSKNLTGLLEAVKKLTSTRSDFVLHLVGAGPDLEKVKALASEWDLINKYVVFTGLKEGDELAGEYRQADFSILSSRYETFGSVVVESLLCGTPVLATDTGVAAELITSVNGVLIKPGDTDELASGISKMLDICRSFSRKAVSESVGNRFAPPTVAGQLLDIYRSAIEK